MKAMVLAVGMSLPIAASASIGMESQQVARSSQDLTQLRQPAGSQGAGGRTHHPLFIVKYELRRAVPDKMPKILMDDSGAQIVPPVAGEYPGVGLGLSGREPNTIVCYGWGCERHP